MKEFMDIPFLDLRKDFSIQNEDITFAVKRVFFIEDIIFLDLKLMNYRQPS